MNFNEFFNNKYGEDWMKTPISQVRYFEMLHETFCEYTDIILETQRSQIELQARGEGLTAR